LGIELTMLTVLSVWALVRVGNGSAPIGHLTPALSWFNPFKVKHFSDFIVGLADMLFIYWGWDTALNLNEETDNAEITPGRRGHLDVLPAGHLRPGHLLGAVLRWNWHPRHWSRQHQPRQ